MHQLGSVSLPSLRLSLDLMTLPCQAESESLDFSLLVSKRTQALVFKDRNDPLNHGKVLSCLLSAASIFPCW